MISVDNIDGLCQVRIAGEMTVYSAPDARLALQQCLAQCTALEIDLSGVSEVDSTSVQLLIQAKREGGRLGKPVSFVAHSPAVQEIIDLYRLGAEFGDPILISSP